MNENDRLRLNVQETSPCIPFLKEPLSIATPTEKQWQAFEKKLYSLGLESLNEEVFAMGRGLIFGLHLEKVKLSIHLGEYTKLKPLHRALNPLTKCRDYPRLFAKVAHESIQSKRNYNEEW